MRKLLRRPSPALIVASLALLVALGGTSVAAVSVALPKGSVGTRQLQNSSVTNLKIANNAINSAKVKNASLLRGDFAPGQLPAGPTGPQGPAGPAGAAGPAGPAGPAGLVSSVTVRQASVAVPGSAADDPIPNTLWVTRSVTVGCNSGEKAMSAGTGWSADADDLELATVYMKPLVATNGAVTGWTARGANNARDGDAHTFTLYVLCYPSA
jgi:hypothetical protein